MKEREKIERVGNLICPNFGGNKNETIKKGDDQSRLKNNLALMNMLCGMEFLGETGEKFEEMKKKMEAIERLEQLNFMNLGCFVPKNEKIAFWNNELRDCTVSDLAEKILAISEQNIKSSPTYFYVLRTLFQEKIFEDDKTKEE